MGVRTSTTKDQENVIEQELKRLHRHTINIDHFNKKVSRKTVKSVLSSNEKYSQSPVSKKASPFYNPKFFDTRFDKHGKMLPQESVSPKKSLDKLSDV